MSVKGNKEYFLGLDMGTSSLGWAVTDTSYNVVRFNGKALWGVRLFDEAKSAEETRGFRTARRRLERQRWRLKMLQEIFAEEIAKVDPGFFMRLQESRLHMEDRENHVKYNLFVEENYTDVDFHHEYPTMYHLRNALVHGSGAFDVRLVYLAIQHIFKHRGHFLFSGLSEGELTDFNKVYERLLSCIHDELENKEDWQCEDVDSLEKILADARLSITAKKSSLSKILPKNDKSDAAIIAFLAGATGKLNELFTDDTLKDFEKNSISFKSNNFDELLPQLEAALGERIEVLLCLKAVYDWSLLANILHNGQFISDSKVAVYQQHKEDLKTLKQLLKKNSKLYNKILRADESAKLYKAYSSAVDGMLQEDFCANLRKQLEKKAEFKKQFKELASADSANTDEEKLLYRINIGTAFPKQTTKDNGVIPMQLHKTELKEILANASWYLPFLSVKDATGLTPAEKIMQIMEFRIPYYVGPLAGSELSRAKHRCWVVKHSDHSAEKIYPWNFNDVVDVKVSAEKFITNMTSKCTYLIGEDVLPKASLLYSEFMLRNELNILSIDGQRLPTEVINHLYEEIFVKTGSRGTKKRILDCLASFGDGKYKTDELGGIDREIKASLRSYRDFCRIFGSQEYVESHYEQIENIIRWITLFSDEKKMLESKIREAYPEISGEQMQAIKKLKYKDWGRLSKTLLESDEISFEDDATGEKITIISALRNTNKNFMELLSANCQYDFFSRIREFNEGKRIVKDKVSYRDVESLYVSPQVKRSIWQTVTVVNEIVKIMGKKPKRIFVEMARSDEEKVATVSRRKRLQELYEKCKDEEPILYAQLADKTDEDLRQDRLYLYFTQRGKCMYTGDTIDLEQLYNQNVYDVDHIYPRSKTKDDSLDNRVLVRRNENAKKKDEYPLSDVIRQKMHKLWLGLLQMGLISRRKYERLTRCTPLSEEELAGFINRQLVETRQSTKAVAEIFKEAYSESEVVYSKAGNVSEFRQAFGFTKNRDINDYHHAKDAYLNIVVGNTYYVKFTKSPLNFIKNSKKEKYSLNMEKMYAYPIERGGEQAWIPGDKGSMAVVKHMMAKNNILFTRMPITGKGGLYKINPLKKGKGQLPLKKALKIENYGGYNSLSTAYFTLVESVKKKKKIRTIETIPLVLAKASEQEINEYLRNELGLEAPKVLIPRIKKYALLEVDSFPIHLSGKTGTNIIGYGAQELCLDDKWGDYLKKCAKYRDDIAKNEACLMDAAQDDVIRNNAQEKLNYYATRWQITADNNIILYDLFIEKMNSRAYINRPALQSKTLQDCRERFNSFKLAEQIKILLEVLKLFKCGSTSADFSLFEKGKVAGRIIFSSNITNRITCFLVNKSPTGVFEEKTDLLKL